MIPSAIILHEAEVELWEAVAYYEHKAHGLGLDGSPGSDLYNGLWGSRRFLSCIRITEEKTTDSRPQTADSDLRGSSVRPRN